MIKEAIFKLVDKQDLTYNEAYQVITEVMRGETSQIQTAAFLSALSTKSATTETIDEIAGCAAAMRALATPVRYDGPTLEIVGTGGDKANTFNISTTAAFVIAAGGVKVSKHGNRAASSKSGTADVQEALGANIHQDPAKACRMLDDVGMTFFFAQDYHTAMKHVGPIRKELGIRTVFNILGPLTNPANPDFFVLGVYSAALVEPLTHVLMNLGVKRGMVVYGEAGLDELSTACPTLISEFSDGSHETRTFDPVDFGFRSCTKADLAGGTAQENAAILRGILDGSVQGPMRDTVRLNAGAGLYVAGAAPSFVDGVRLAGTLIDSGAASRKLEAYVKASNEPLSER